MTETTFPAERFSAWLAAMYAAGRIASDAQAARLLGVTTDSLCTYKLRGVPRHRARMVALACAALAKGLEPWE